MLGIIKKTFIDCNWTRTQNHLVLKRASLAKWLSVRLRTKWFWVRVQLQSLHQKYLLPISVQRFQVDNLFCWNICFKENNKKNMISICCCACIRTDVGIAILGFQKFVDIYDNVY